MTPNLETRRLATPPTADPARANRVRGYAAVFNSPSEVLTERGRTFREVILPGAFARAVASEADVLALWQHGADGRPPLGRTTAGTLALRQDARGLAFELDLPNAAGDVLESIRRGDVWGMSFGFRNEVDSWSRRDGHDWREISALDLIEISIVAHPAYPSASVDARNRSAVEVPVRPDQAGRRRRLLALAERVQ